ncbi:MAG: rhomboid family intramembrane serine protease [Dehalococcoidia bacterium]
MTFPALAQRKLGLGRLPIVTGIVFVVTATMSFLQRAIPGMFDALQRDPTGLHGEWWRTFTALFVQDGGIVGTIVNLAFLLVLGALTEQILNRRQWLVCYFGTGLAGELAGYAWQPHGAGNSVAVCGLAAAMVVALWLDEARVPKLAPIAVLYWCGGLLSTLFWPALIVYLIGGVLVQITMQHGHLVGRPVAAAVAVAAVILLAATDIHGAALAAGMIIAAVIVLAGRTRLPLPAPNATAREKGT